MILIPKCIKMHIPQILKIQTCQLYILTSKWTKTFLVLNEINATHVYDIPKELKRSKDNDFESIWDWLAKN